MEGGGESILRVVARQKQEADAAARKKAGIEEPVPEPSLEQILRSEDREFAECLESLAASDPRYKSVAERVKKGESNQDNLPLLVQARAEYLERKKKGESLVKMLESYSDELILHAPLLRGVVETAGAENFRSILNQGLLSLARKDPRAAKRVADAYKGLQHFDNNENKTATDKIARFRETYKADVTLPVEEYATALNQANYKDRVNKLYELVKPAWYQWSKRDSLKELAKTDLKTLSETRNRLLEAGGLFLHALAQTNRPEIREALERAATLQEPKFKEGVDTHMTFEQMKAQKDMPETVSEAAAKLRATEFRQKHKDVFEKAKHGNKKDKDRAEEAIENYYLNEELLTAEYEKRDKQNTGFWAAVWRGLAVVFKARGNADVDRILRS